VQLAHPVSPSGLPKRALVLRPFLLGHPPQLLCCADELNLRAKGEMLRGG